MSGHSKWATIKRKKGANDAQRGKIFTKFARELQLAAREGPDPNFNFRLRLIIDKAKAENMPKDNIDRAVKRGAGMAGDGTAIEEVTYEGYGAHGVAIYLETLTDNKNRTVSDIRRTLVRGGGSLGESGSVAWLFDAKGHIAVQMAGRNQDKVFELALDAGAEDVQFGEDSADVYSDVSDLQSVQKAFVDAGYKLETSELTRVPKTYVSLSPSDTLQVMGLLELLEDLDDVTKVYSNLEITDEALAKMDL
jgi:YebC/PmpR family DNA-binding regulatory protein